MIGGGIVGLACARELALRGLAVELLERGEPGAQASRAAAGMLAPLAEFPRPGPLLEACRASRDLWGQWLEGIVEESGQAVEYDRSGTLVVALNAEDEGFVERLAAAARELGEAAERVGAAELRRRVPDLSPAARGGLLLAGEHRVDNAAACRALAAAARRQGVALRSGAAVEGVEKGPQGVRVTAAGARREAPWLVLAAGAWSGGIPGLPPLPVRPVRGQMLEIGGVRWPWRGSVRGRARYGVRRGCHGLLIGATVEEAGFQDRPTVAGIADLLAFARTLFPGLGERPLERAWSGLRPGTPDGRPIVGRLPGWPAVAATGHFRNGILLAPWTAREVARLLLEPGYGEPAAFDPGRFAAGSGGPI